MIKAYLRQVLLAIVLVFVVLVPHLQVQGQRPQSASSADEYEFAFDGASPDLVAKRKAILDEADGGNAGEWAGRYMADVGELSYRSLIWAPHSGYLLYRYSDTPWPLDLSVGRASIDGEFLRLTSDVPIPSVGVPSYRDTYRLIRWGERHYLVAQEDLTEFCCAVNSTAEDETGRFLRKSEHTSEPTGYPNVPAEFVRYLRLPVLTVRIIGVDSDRIARDEWPPYRVGVRLSAGEDYRIAVGMAFWLADARRKTRLKFRVSSVGTHTSEAKLVELWWGQGDTSDFPRIGGALRNRPSRRDREPWNR